MFSNRDLRRLLIPLMIEQLLSALMGIADTLMVTRVGDSAISAVSCVDSVNTLMLFLFSALSTGGTIVCSQYIGCEDDRGANNSARQVVLVSLSLSLLLMLLCIVLRVQLLRLVFGTVEPAIMDQAVTYFLITACSYPFLALQQTSAALFRAEGNSRLPMAVTAAANAMNVAGNAILIFGCGWGVAGAAVSTLAARVFSAVALLLFQRRPTNRICLDHYLRIRPDWPLIRVILRIGIPSGLENGLFQFGKLVVQSTVSTLGTTAIAAQAMLYNLDTFQSMPAIAIGLGMLTVVGQCMGAGRPDEARRYIRRLCLLSELVIFVMSGVMLALTKPIVWLSGLGADAAHLTYETILYISLAKITLWVVAFTLPNGLRAAGDVLYTAIVSAASMWIFRVGLSALLCRFLGVGLIGVWIGWFVDWLCRDVFYFFRYRSGRWAEKSVLQ